MKNYHDQYINAKPFPFIVIDDYMNPSLLKNIVKNWPNDEQFRQYSDNKRAYHGYQNYYNFFFSKLFISQLEGLTGIDNLCLSKELAYSGSGLHETMNGGKLGIHIDFNKKKEEPAVYRRVNVMIYLNEYWNRGWGGILELWEATPEKLIRKAVEVMPTFNRMIIFTTSEISYHGHPIPVKAPKDITRKSLALYYYTEAPPDDYSGKSHSTIYKTA